MEEFIDYLALQKHLYEHIATIDIPDFTKSETQGRQKVLLDVIDNLPLELKKEVFSQYIKIRRKM